MAIKGNANVADFATLAEKLLEHEQEEFGGPAQGAAKTWRRKIIRVVGSSRVNRERLGVLLAHGKQHFKKGQVWLSVKESVAKAAGYKSRRSIETLMDDALRARGLRNASADRYHALERCGVDAAETRWAKLIDELSKDIPENETPKAARLKVEELYTAFMKSKPKKGDSGGSKVERLHGRIEKLVVQLFGHLAKDQREAVIQQIVAEATKKADEAALQKAANAQPVLVVSNTDKDQDQVAMVERTNPPGASVPFRGPAHPWGDAFLGSLIPGERRQDPLEFNERALYRALNDMKPKRFFVGDLFATGVTDHIAGRHIEFFRKADRHTYLVLTTNIQRMLEFGNRTIELRTAQYLWFGLSITSSSDFNQIDALGDLETPNKWVCLLPFQSGKPIRESSPAFEEILRRAGVSWVVFGGDQKYGWEISEEDEDEIVRASHAAGCRAYCTSIQTKEDLVRSGSVDPASVPGVVKNSVLGRKTWKLRELPDFTHASLSLSA